MNNNELEFLRNENGQLKQVIEGARRDIQNLMGILQQHGVNTSQIALSLPPYPPQMPVYQPPYPSTSYAPPNQPYTQVAYDGAPDRIRDLLQIHSNVVDDSRMLLVTAAPSKNDKYYKKVYNQILDFQAGYAKSVLGKDNFVILCDDTAYKYFREKHALPEDIMIKEAMLDIWMRDFTLSCPYKPIMTQYSAAGQSGSKRESTAVQAKFRDFCKANGLQFEDCTKRVVMDGGLMVDNYTDKAVVTTKFLDDNKVSYKNGKKLLKETLNVSQVAIIESDDPDGLSHADGVLMFADENTILVRKFKDRKLSKEIMAELQESFPSTEIVIFDCIHAEEADNETDFDEDFESAFGIYVNSVLTRKYLYVPLFNISDDGPKVEEIRRHTSKEVVPVMCGKYVSRIGGSIRCLTCQMYGRNAEILINKARQ